MSWSGQVTAPFGNPSQNSEAIHAIKCFGQGDLPEAQEAIHWAIEAATLLVNSGAVGAIESDGEAGTDGEFYVSLSGHANPDHVAPGGWSNDTITINVSHRPAPLKLHVGSDAGELTQPAA